MFLHVLAAPNTTAEEEWRGYEACVGVTAAGGVEYLRGRQSSHLRSLHLKGRLLSHVSVLHISPSFDRGYVVICINKQTVINWLEP